MNSPYDREILNTREKPLSSDINELQSYADLELRYFLMNLFNGRTSSSDIANGTPVSGFIGRGLQVRPDNPADGSIVIKAGTGFMYDPSNDQTNLFAIPGLDDTNSWKPVVLNADFTGFAVPAAPTAGSQTRIDLIECRYNRQLADATSRLVLNATTGIFEGNTVFKTLTWALDVSTGAVVSPALSTAALSYKQGVAGTPGVAPSVTPGYVALAYINVANSASTYDSDVITDERLLLFPYNDGSVSFNVSMPTSGGSIVPTLSDVEAPPGTNVVAVGQSVTNGSVFVYVWGGAFSGSILPKISVTPFSSSNASAVAGQSSFVTADSALQTAIAGAAANPTGQKIAVGQKLIKIALLEAGGVNPTVYSVQMRMKGG